MSCYLKGPALWVRGDAQNPESCNSSILVFGYVFLFKQEYCLSGSCLKLLKLTWMSKTNLWCECKVYPMYSKDYGQQVSWGKRGNTWVKWNPICGRKPREQHWNDDIWGNRWHLVALTWNPAKSFTRGIWRCKQKGNRRTREKNLDAGCYFVLLPPSPFLLNYPWLCSICSFQAHIWYFQYICMCLSTNGIKAPAYKYTSEKNLFKLYNKSNRKAMAALQNEGTNAGTTGP